MLRELFRRRRAQKPGQLGREYRVGDVIEQRFEVESVRRGFMGIVYIVYDRQRRQRVVLKTFQNKFLWDEEAIKRFNAEVELWMRLGSHSNIVRALDLRTFMGKPHVIAEYVHGGALRTLVGHLSLREALDYSIQICWGMGYAVQQAAIMHRDLKPDNIMVTLDGQIKVTDFGLAKALPRWQWQASQLDPRSAAMRLKHQVAPDVMAGTLPYMAPELFDESGTTGVWTDIYAFGITFYELLTGKLPFDAIHDESLIRMQMRAQPPDPRIRKPDLPPEAVAIVMRCLAKRPLERYQSWAEVEDDLQELRIQVVGTPFLATFPDDDVAESERLIEQGMAHTKLGEYSDAKRCFQEATDRDRGRADTWCHLALVYLHMWEYREGLVAVEEGLRRAVSRNEFGQLFCARGEIYAKMQMGNEALAAYDQGLSYTPNAPRLWREKGALLMQLHQFRDAQHCAERALEFDKLDSRAWHQLGDIQLRQGREKKAQDAYSEALKLNPRDPLTWARYGYCQLHSGSTRDALASFEMALKIDPDNTEALDGRRRVQRL
ncbi:MAG: protein kinase [Roseiflexaceae bacterium]|nr:protein kinase [Roseiflexaceae bacterium]